MFLGIIGGGIVGVVGSALGYTPKTSAMIGFVLGVFAYSVGITIGLGALVVVLAGMFVWKRLLAA